MLDLPKDAPPKVEKGKKKREDVILHTPWDYFVQDLQNCWELMREMWNTMENQSDM